MTLNHDFTNAKVGDPIYTLHWGEGVIYEICPKHDYPIVVHFVSKIESFTMDGKYRISDLHITAFTEPIKVVPASYEPFQEQEMMVWGYDIKAACKRVVFANPRGKFAAYYAARTVEEIGNSNEVYIWDNALPIHEWEAKVKQSKNQQEITEIENQIAELQAKLEKLKG